MPRSGHGTSSNVEGKLPRVRGDVHEESSPSRAPPLGTKGSTNFDYVDHVSDSADVLPSTRGAGAEIVGEVSEDVWTDDADVPEDPSDVK